MRHDGQQQQRRRGQGWCSVALCVALWCAPAAGGAEQTPGLARVEDTAVLITELVRATPDAKPTPAFWWSSLQAPKPTQTDEALRTALQSRGVTWRLDSGAGKSISKIYLRPDLSHENASALGNLLGARRVYYGAVVYEPVSGPGALGGSGWRATVQLQLVEATTQRATHSPLVLERVVFGAESQRRLREEVASTLGALMARQLRLTTTPVGPGQGEERWVILRGARRGEVLDRALMVLRGVPGVEDVVVRWSAEGHIALELNPGKRDEDALVEAAARALSELVEPVASGLRFERARAASVAGGEVLDVVERQGLEGR